jgi:L-iditol 2-dehydrogenase
MIAAELVSPRQFRVVEREMQKPRPGEVRVKVDAVGICGSDLHSYSDGAIGDTPLQYPMVLGHEPAGTVAEVGPGVTGWAVGDRAALEPALYCYHCEFCLSGRYNICANIKFMSSPPDPGFFREYVNLPAHNLFPIPASLSAELATVAEPLAVVLHSMKIAGVQIGETVAVLGTGPIGLMTVACLRLSGAGRVFAIDPVPHRREMAKQMGADDVFDTRETESSAAIRAATGGRGVDCVIDCAAHDDSTNAAIRAARNGGRVVLTGIHSGSKFALEMSTMRRKEIVFLNVRRSNDEPPVALKLLLERPELFAPMMTHTRPLEKVAEAFNIAEHYSDGVGKMIIR